MVLYTNTQTSQQPTCITIIIASEFAHTSWGYPSMPQKEFDEPMATLIQPRSISVFSQTLGLITAISGFSYIILYCNI